MFDHTLALIARYTASSAILFLRTDEAADPNLPKKFWMVRWSANHAMFIFIAAATKPIKIILFPHNYEHDVFRTAHL